MGLGKNYVPHMVGTLRKTPNSGGLCILLRLPLSKLTTKWRKLTYFETTRPISTGLKT